MNNHQIKRRRVDGLTPAVLGVIVAVAVALLIGVAIHEAFSTVEAALRQAGA